MTALRTRLHVEAPLAAGATVALDADRAHYLLHVLRLKPGAAVALFNGRDGEWRASLAEAGKRGAALAVEAQLRPQAAEPDLWLCFAPIKSGRIDFLAEKAGELGAAVLQPVLTRHTDVARVNTDRLRANAREAAEQCERLSVPAVQEPVDLARLLAVWDSQRILYVCSESGSAPPFAEVLAARAPGPAAVMIGPEGGFARLELDELARHPFVLRVGLGPRILRAETAAVAALACWQALHGDWTAPPPHRG